MSEVILKIETEDREGVLAVGSYLIDAAGRLGIRIEDDPAANGGRHSCGIIVKTGANLLSDLTQKEQDQFSAHGRRTDERLACQTKLIKTGEVVIMTDDKKTEASKEETDEHSKAHFRKEFEEMPLERKIASLLELEFIAFGETVKFVFDSPYKIFDKVLDVMAEFGLKKDEEARKASRPKEHQDENHGGAEDAKTHGRGKDAPAVG